MKKDLFWVIFFGLALIVITAQYHQPKQENMAKKNFAVWEKFIRDSGYITPNDAWGSHRYEHAEYSLKLSKAGTTILLFEKKKKQATYFSVDPDELLSDVH